MSLIEDLRAAHPGYIAHGLQHVVYDLSDGRVNKVPLTTGQSKTVVSSWYPPDEAPTELLAIDYALETRRAINRMQRFLARHPALAPSLGNPEFIGDRGYTQDRVVTLGMVLQASTELKRQSLLIQYAELVRFLWSYGFAETVFNFTINNGVNARGEVIVLDLGEAAFNKRKARQTVVRQRWLRSWSFTSDVPEQQRPYYEALMSRQLTEHSLGSFWKAELRK